MFVRLLVPVCALCVSACDIKPEHHYKLDLWAYAYGPNVGIMVSTLLRGSQWHFGRKRKSAVTNVGWVRLPAWKWSKVGHGTVRYQFKKAYLCWACSKFDGLLHKTHQAAAGIKIKRLVEFKSTILSKIHKIWCYHTSSSQSNKATKIAKSWDKMFIAYAKKSLLGK